MADQLTSEGLAVRLPLLNAKAVCDRAGVDYMRFRNWKFGSVKSLSDDELKRIAKVLESLHADLDWEGANSRCPDPSCSLWVRELRSGLQMIAECEQGDLSDADAVRIMRQIAQLTLRADKVFQERENA